MSIITRINKAEKRIVDLYNKLKNLPSGETPTPVDPRPYKVYTALIRHNGTTDTSIVFENTLGFDVTWTKTATGEIVSNISVSSPNVFINNLIEDQIQFTGTLPSVQYTRTARDYSAGGFLKLQKKFFNSAGGVSPMDGISINVEIRVYN